MYSRESHPWNDGAMVGRQTLTILMSHSIVLDTENGTNV